MFIRRYWYFKKTRFVGTIGTQKLLKYLENKGEGSGGNQPYIHKFLIPILGVSFFFAPIPEGNLPNQSTTIVQNIIRYFTATGNQIADMASQRGIEVYINKLYNRVGGMSPTQKMYIETTKILEEHKAAEHHRLFEEICKPRFRNGTGLGGVESILDEIANNEATREDIVSKFIPAQSNAQDITADACITSFKIEPESTRNAKRYNEQLLAADNYKKTSLPKTLETIDNYIANKVKEFGWFQGVLIPGTGLMVEVQDYITDNSVQSEDKGNDAVALSRKSDITAIQQAQQAKINSYDRGKDVLVEEAMQYLVYFILPGTNSIRQFISELTENGAAVLGAIVGYFTPLPGGTLIASLIAKSAGGLIAPFTGFFGAVWAVEGILLYSPAIVGTLAGTIAFLSYIVGLCKYFYISPFVVAFSITTKRQEKIIDFLLAGVSIFFKPILIVLFIFLSLFLYVLVKDVMLVISESQFNILQVTDLNIGAYIAIGSIKALFKIFASIASCYIMWRLIIKGPDWVMDLIGIKGGQDTIVSDSLAQNLERRSMMIR